MVTAVVTPPPNVRPLPGWLRPYVVAYLSVVAGILLVASAVHGIAPVRDALHSVLPFKWSVAPHDPNARTIGTALSLWLHNAKLSLAPIALAAAVQAHPGKLRRTGDLLLGFIFLLDLLPFAVDLGTWGSKLIPYIPNAPVELLAATSGFVSWWLVTRGRLSPRSLLSVVAVVAPLLLIAACLETWAVA